jgi:hypothetical protein
MAIRKEITGINVEVNTSGELVLLVAEDITYYNEPSCDGDTLPDRTTSTVRDAEVSDLGQILYQGLIVIK